MQRIHLITWGWNEEKLLPYFLKYFSFCEKITIRDDYSTDRSHEIIKSFPNTEIIFKPQPNGKPEIDDTEGLIFANNYYKNDRSYDWIILCSMDEFLYHPNLLEKLEEYKRLGVTIPRTVGFDMWTDKEILEDKPLHEVITLGRYSPNHSKCVIFNPKIDINYTVGMHFCNPTGDVKWSDDLEFKVLHFLYQGYKVFVERRKLYWDQLSDENKRRGWGAHNKTMSEMTEREYGELGKTMTKVL